MSRRPGYPKRCKGVLAPGTPAEDGDRDELIPITSEGRLWFAIIAGVTSAILGVLAITLTGVAIRFAGFGSGGGWEAIALVSLVVWLGGLAAVLVIARNVFFGQRLPIGSAVAACAAATIVTLAVGMGIGGRVGQFGLPVLLVLAAAAATAVTWAVSR